MYSVPSRLIGHQLRVRIYDERLSCYLNADHVLDLDRVRITKDMAKAEKVRCINYRHLIHSLARKPGAFRYSVLRDEILPNDTYRKIWETIDSCCTEKHANKLMVGILKIAANYDCETQLGDHVISMLAKKQVPCLGTLDNMYKSKYAPIAENVVCGTNGHDSNSSDDKRSNAESELLQTLVRAIPLVNTVQHSLDSYDALLTFRTISNVAAISNVEVCHDQY